MGQGRRGTSLEEARARAHGVHPRSLPRSHRGGCVCSCRKGKGSIRKGSIPDLPERPAEARPALCPPRDLDDLDDMDDMDDPDDLDLDLDLDRAESQPISTGGTTLSTRPSGARLGRAGGEGGATRGWATVPLALARGVRPRPRPSRSHQPRSDPKPWRQHAEPTSGRAGGIPPLLVPYWVRACESPRCWEREMNSPPCALPCALAARPRLLKAERRAVRAVERRASERPAYVYRVGGGPRWASVGARWGAGGASGAVYTHAHTSVTRPPPSCAVVCDFLWGLAFEYDESGEPTCNRGLLRCLSAGVDVSSRWRRQYSRPRWSVGWSHVVVTWCWFRESDHARRLSRA